MTSVNQALFFNRVKVLVKLGLLEFWSRSLPEDERVVPLLKLEINAQLVGSENELDWREFKKSLAKQLNLAKLNNPLLRLVVDSRLKLADFFVLGLLGEIESSHLVNLVIGELQLPDKSVRPSVHTLNAIVETLFDDDERNNNFILNLTDHPLIKNGWLEVSGDGPLPLKKLKIEPTVWRYLTGFESAWPNCQFISLDRYNELGKQNVKAAKQFAAFFRSTLAKNRSTRQNDKTDNRQNTSDDIKTLVIRGVPGSGRGSFAALLANELKLKAIEIPVTSWVENKVLAKLCEYLSWLPVIRPSLGPGEVFRVENTTQSIVILLGSEGSVDADNLMEAEVHVPDAGERIRLWQKVIQNKPIARLLGESALISGGTIRSLGISAARLAEKEKNSLKLEHINIARRHFGGEKLRLLAQPVFRQIDRKNIIIPDTVADGLEHLLLRAQKREAICQGMGATLAATASSGVRGLFVGESGTGKTLAASFVSTQMGAPLYRVDLASVMNKYIGESEKNLGLLLDQAIANDVVLLFDEADSLFGSRTDGNETGERYANMLTNFLLTRIENHPGVVILTTNSEERIDSAFNRRIDVIVNFPMPGYSERLALWHSHLGERGPGDQVYQLLASYCDFAGGQIRNAVLAAATYSDGKHISIDNLVSGLTLEYSKVGRKLPGKILQLAAQ